MERFEQQVDGRTPQIKALNTHLDNVKFKFKEKYRSLLDKEATITAPIRENAYLGNEPEQKGHSICELMGYHTKMEGEKLSLGTLKNYVTTEDYVKRFIKTKFGKEDLFLKQLNQEFIIKFEYLIRNNPLKQHDPCVGNGLMKHMERLKKMARWSRQLGWLEHDPFIDYKLSFKRNKRKKLDLSQLAKIEKQNFSNQSIATKKRF